MKPFEPLEAMKFIRICGKPRKSSSVQYEQSAHVAAKCVLGEMAQKNRASVDLSGLRDRIENAYSDPFWQELSLAKKLRILLQDRINGIEEDRDEENKAVSNDYSSEAGLEAIAFVAAIAIGKRPSNSNMVILAAALNLPAEVLMDICDRLSLTDETNGSEDKKNASC